MSPPAGATLRAEHPPHEGWFPPPPLRRRWLLLTSAGFTLFVVFGVWFFVFAYHRPTIFNIEDARVYLGAASAVVHGHSLYAGRFTSVHLPYLYPPFAALGYVPLTVLPASWSHVLVRAVNVALVVLIAHVSFRESRLPRWAQLGLTLALVGGGLWFEPIAETYKFGQLNLMLVALVLLDVTGRHGRLPQGVLTGLATALKLTPGIFLLYLALTHRRSSAVRGLATFVATVVLSLAVIPREAWHYWTGGFLDTHLGLGYNGQHFYYLGFIGNQSLKAMINRFSGTMHGGGGLWLVCAIITLVVGLFAARFWQRRSELAGVSVCAITGLLVSPISWTHHWVWALPLVALTVGWAWERPNLWRVVLALATIELWLSYAPWSVPHTNQQEYHLHGVQHLTGNLYTWVGLLAVFTAFGAAVFRVRAARTRAPVAAPADAAPVTAPADP